MLDKAEHFYILECDDEWVEALELTFRDCEKVEIVPKFLGESDGENIVCLDTLCRNIKADLIKMDIEGDEIKALRGGVTIERENPNCIYLLCAYHYQDEEKEIRDFFSRDLFDGYEVKNRPGYMFFYHDKNQKSPYLRRGLLVAKPKP